ncbi:MAG: VCBS repeat-containing protein [candidate division Zixibacteria bacterium]|nr:VCBS repeat-containing protein [candidate division Zixibacteria bacterium]
MSVLIKLFAIGCFLIGGTAQSADVPLGTMPFWSTSEQNIYSTGMIWRDCNRDGVIDVFYSNGNDIVQAANNIYLFGGDQFPVSAAWYSSNQEYSGHCAVGDINDDGYPDLMVSDYLGSGFSDPNQSEFYLNDGGLPNAIPVWSTPDLIFSFSCAFGDVDGDGDLDVAFATGEGYQNDYQQDIIYLNVDGNFSNSIYWNSDAVGASMDVAWGDVDNDGDLDLAFTYDATATSVYYNDNGVMETTPSWQAGTTESGNTLVFGDVNGDGWLDLMVAYNNQLGGGGRFRVYFNDGAGNLDPNYGWQSSTGGYGSALALGDYDNDGDYDLATGRWWSTLWVYENLGTTFTTAPVWTSGLECVAEELAWVDIDGASVVSLIDTLPMDGSRKLFYTEYQPLYEVDSVYADGSKLGYADYCYDLVSGWVSLAEAPTTEAVCFYRYSFHNDLAVSNWDTVNFVFANTNPPLVDITVANAFGPVPLTVQFDDNSVGAYEWSWDFGDGETSADQNPLYEYTQPGRYDVTLEITTPERNYTRVFDDLVSVYADTLWMEKVAFVDNKARVDVYAYNYMPLSEIIIPFSWDGPLDVRFDSISVNGLRTEYFDTHGVIDLVTVLDAATVRLAVGTQAPLEPGTGSIVSLYFTYLGSETSGSSPIRFWNYDTRELSLLCPAGYYVSETIDGAVVLDCCLSRVGDVNGEGGDEPTIGDVSCLIDAVFITGNCEGVIDCLAEADINQSGGSDPICDDITIGDISVLIDYLFITGVTLGLPSCL